MSFASRSPKYPPVYQTTIKQIGRIGPGSYNPYKSDDLATSCGSQHIFNSKIQRNLQFSPCASNQNVGPGKYQSSQAYCKFIIKKQTHACQSSFKSKIQRFPKRQHSATDKQQKDMNIYDCLMQKDTQKKKIGKLYGIERDHSKISQNIPSIPCNQQSYGYRVDPKTKKLVQNQNPNVLLARKTFANSVENRILNTTDAYTAPGSYFLNGQHYKKIKGLKWYKDSKSIGHSQQKQNHPDFSRPSQLINLQTMIQNKKRQWQEKGQIITSKQRRFEYQKLNKKQQLIKNSIKKKFQQYITNDDQIQTLLNNRSKYKHKNNNSQQKLGRQPIITQCFLSKQRRFFNQEPHKLQQKDNFALVSSRIGQSGCLNQQKINSDQKSHKGKSLTGKNLGFGFKEQRFCQFQQLKNRIVGPCTYNNYPIDSLHHRYATKSPESQKEKKYSLKNQNKLNFLNMVNNPANYGVNKQEQNQISSILN